MTKSPRNNMVLVYDLRRDFGQRGRILSQEQERIIKQDWKQYEAWLRK